MLESGADVDGVAADERAAFARGSHDDLAGVDPDPQRELSGERLRQPPLHRQRCMQRPLGVVLLRGRCAESSHDRVADELLHGAARAVDLGGHCVVEAVEHRARALGVARVGELGRADEVREEDRRDLALLARFRARDGCGADWAEVRAARELSPTGRACRHVVFYRGRRANTRLTALRLRGAVADGLDVVAIRVGDERRVVVLVVVLADSRRALVRAAGTDGRGVERVHGRPVPDLEGDVRGCGRFLAAAHSEHRSALLSEADEALPLHGHRVADSLERLLVEAPTPVDIRHIERNVVDHGRPSVPLSGCLRADYVPSRERPRNILAHASVFTHVR